MEEIRIKSLDVLNEKQKLLRPASRLYYYYVDHADKLNRVSIKKETLAQALNVSPRTVSNWVRALADAGLIKYKYSGSARLNPKNYFIGTANDYNAALEEYSRFRSDV